MNKCKRCGCPTTKKELCYECYKDLREEEAKKIIMNIKEYVAPIEMSRGY